MMPMATSSEPLIDVLPKASIAAAKRAASKASAALIDRDDAIREAIADGATLRAVAEAVGLSFARIHQIVNHR
jgi:hypothetical protein